MQTETASQRPIDNNTQKLIHTEESIYADIHTYLKIYSQRQKPRDKLIPPHKNKLTRIVTYIYRYRHIHVSRKTPICTDTNTSIKTQTQKKIRDAQKHINSHTLTDINTLTNTQACKDMPTHMKILIQIYAYLHMQISTRRHTPQHTFIYSNLNSTSFYLTLNIISKLGWKIHFAKNNTILTWQNL